jgi:Spy/CpxP family protein refolding chaperone
MKRSGWLGVVVLAGLAVLAELGMTASVFAQEKPAPAEHAMVMPDVDQHLKVLSEKLSLTAEQQEKARPILKDMQDGMQKVADNKSLTPDQMHEQMHSTMMRADKQLREFLTGEQKTTLDAMEKEMHHEKQ